MLEQWIKGGSSAVGLVLMATGAPAAAGTGDAAAAASEPQAVAIQMNVSHTGVTSTKAPFKFPLAEYWRREFAGSVSYPLIANGRVFVTVADPSSYGSTLFALDVETGKGLWKSSIEGTYYWAAAAYDAGRVYVINVDGLLKAFNASTGFLEWSVQVPAEYFVTSPPVAQGGLVYIEGDGSHSLTAYDEASGALLWSQEIPAGLGAPTIGAGTIFGSSPCQAFALNAITGKPRWNFNGGCVGGGGVAPVYSNGKLYVTDLFGSGNQILNAHTGAVVGPFDAAAGQPVVGGEQAYYVTSEGLQAQSIKTGESIWSFAGDGGISLLPIKVNETVFVGSSSGQLWGLEGVTGKEQWSTNVGDPIVANVCCASPSAGLAEADGFLVVPASSSLVAYHTSLASTKGTVIANLQQGTAPPVDVPFNPKDPTSYNASTSTMVCDLRGDSYPLTFYFANTATSGVWDVYATINDVVVSANPTTTTLTFASAGKLKEPKNGNLTFAYAPPNGAARLAVTFDFSATTSYNAAFGVTSITENGCK